MICGGRGFYVDFMLNFMLKFPDSALNLEGAVFIPVLFENS